MTRFNATLGLTLKRLRFLALVALVATPACPATTFTNDRIDGTPVIEQLDVDSLAPGQAYRFWFRATDNSIGQAWYVPVIVIKGAKPGPRLMLTAAIHGDELNGVDVIHQLVAKTNPGTLTGTLIGVPGLNIPGLLHHTRGFTPGDGRDGENLNRIMPGGAGGDDDSPNLYAGRLWTGLLRPNADTTIDLHTQSRGTAYVVYAFAATPRARRIAELIAPDILKLDPGVKGTVELEMIRAGVPAITLELARPEEFDPVVVRRAVEGIERVMVDMKMLPAGAAPPATVSPFVGNKLVQVRAGRGGFAHILVKLGDAVTQGQAVATICDPFGRVIETITAPESGRINTVATDPLRDPGDLLMRIVFVSSEKKCRNGC